MVNVSRFTRTVIVFIALYTVYAFILVVVGREALIPSNRHTIGFVISPNLKYLAATDILLASGLLVSYFLTGSVLGYLTAMASSIYILSLQASRIGLYELSLTVVLPSSITLIPVIIHAVRRKKSVEPWATKIRVCSPRRGLRTPIMGFLSGLGIGYSILGLTGLNTYFNSYLLWGLGALLSSVLGLCALKRTPVLLGLLASFSILSLPLTLIMSLASPLKLELKSGKRGLASIRGGLYFWSRLDSLDHPFDYCEGIVGWHWAEIEGSQLFIENIMDPKNPNLNTIVVGRSGSGKSTVTKKLVKFFYQYGYSVLILDFHGEYNSIDGNFIRVDLWSSDYYLDLNSIPGDEEFRAQLVADAFKSVFPIGERQYSILYDALTDYFLTETDSNLAESVSKNIAGLEGSTSDTSILGLIQYLRQLERFFKGEKPINLLLNSGSSIVIDMSKIPGIHLKLALSEFILRIIYNTMNNNAEARRVVVVEEAHHFGDSSILGKLYSEARKFGLAIIGVTQNPRSLPRDIVVNASNKFIFGLDEPDNLNYALGMTVPVDRQQENVLRYTIANLPPGFSVYENKSLASELFIIKVF